MHPPTLSFTGSDAHASASLTRRDLLRLGVTSLAVPFLPQAPAPPGKPSLRGGKAVLAPSDLVFRGFIRFPLGVGDLWFASKVLTMRRVGSDLRAFIIGNVTEDQPLFEVSVPDNPSLSIDTSPLCMFRRKWGAIMLGRQLTGGSAGAYAGGLHWDAPRNALWWSYGDLYAPVQSHPTIGCTVLDDTAGTFRSYGPWRTQWVSQRTRGAFAVIPAEFAAANTEGRTVGMMSGTSSGAAGSPFGAILSAMSLPDPLTTPPDVLTSTSWTVDNHGVILHDIDHPQPRDARYKLCGWAVPYDCRLGVTLRPGTPVWGGPDPAASSDTMASCVWIDLPDKHGLLYLGQLTTTPDGYVAPGDPDGLVHMWYGNAFHQSTPTRAINVCCHEQDDPFWGTTGPGAHYRVPKAWIYNPADLVATAQGRADLWTRQPVSEFAFRDRAPQMFGRYPQSSLGGVHFDEQTRRLYVMIGTHDTITTALNSRPCLMVFDVM